MLTVDASSFFCVDYMFQGGLVRDVSLSGGSMGEVLEVLSTECRGFCFGEGPIGDGLVEGGFNGRSCWIEGWGDVVGYWEEWWVDDTLGS